MSIDADFWQQVKTPSGQTQILRKEKKNSPGRDLIFRKLFPGVFVVMVFYRIFVVEPESGEFYTKLAAKVMTRMYMTGAPEMPVKHQSASNNPQRSSVDSTRRGPTV
jgi:hypothetical protein